MDGYITIGTKLDTKEFDAQIKNVEGKIEDLEKQELYFQREGMTGELQDVQTELEKTKNKLISLKQQKDKATQPSGIVGMSDAFKTVNSSLQNAVSKATRLALGIFGIRSAYMALRRASSDLANYDKQYAANIEYIRYALTQMIAPVLKYIVSLAATLLNYINAILQGWFGINLFSNASAKSFKKMKQSSGGIGKSISGASKAAKELKKQLAGFDEMNVLSDEKSKSDGGGSSAGGGGGFTAPEFNLGGTQEIPEWLKWIIDNRDLILSILSGILAFIIAIKLGLGLIKALGIGVAIAGIVYAVQAIIAYLNDPSWKNFGKIIQGIGIAIIGLGIAFLGLPAVIVGAIVLIVGTIIKYWDQIKAFFQGGIDWLKEKSDWVRQTFGDTIGDIYDFIVTFSQDALDIFDAIFTTIKGVFDGIIKFISGVFSGDWEKAWEGIKEIFGSIWNGIVKIFTDIFDIIKTKVVTVAKVTGSVIAGAFKAVVNSVLSNIETILNVPIGAINTLISVINSVPGINLGRLPTFNLPRLKSGGIINMPNRGTLVGSAIAGESGREGVIPLTDSQAMETLGEAIGRYITINANITNTMNGRIISRQLQQIQAEQNFAYNS